MRGGAMAKEKTEYTYDENTQRWLENANISKRKQHGQYMTPNEVGTQLVGKLGVFPQGAKVLDPAVGTGELLKAVQEKHPGVETFGWELDPEILQYGMKSLPDTTFVNQDALLVSKNPVHDIVIGNPPFFEFSPDMTVKKMYADVIKGRVNIYGLFFKVGLDALKPGGKLAYIVPPSMNTGAYFEKLRSYILQHATIESLEIVVEQNMFDQAQVVIQLIVLKKRETPLAVDKIPTRGKHYYIYDNGLAGEDNFRKIIFCEDAKALETYFVQPNTYSLWDIGYTVKTGTIVWNQRRDILGNDDTVVGVKKLLWSKDISKDNTLCLSDKVKYRYIATDDYEVGPAILANRIVGSVGNPCVKFAYVGGGEKFLAENHVNVVSADNNRKQSFPPKTVYEKLCQTDFSDVLKSVTGSTQLSSKELNYLLRLQF